MADVTIPDTKVVGPQNPLYKAANPNYAPKRYEAEGLKD